MWEIVALAVTYIFAIYGLSSLFRDMVREIRFRKQMNGNIRFILAVKNGQETVEGVIRQFILEQESGRIPADNGLTVIDLGSEDQTMEILQSLEREYSTLNVMEDFSIYGSKIMEN